MRRELTIAVSGLTGFWGPRSLPVHVRTARTWTGKLRDFRYIVESLVSLHTGRI